jgi:ABC-type glycerol-3-phosphate transport system substrate-binding protein
MNSMLTRSPHRHGSARRLAALAVAAAAVAVAAACSSGESALVIDQEETTDPPAATSDATDATDPTATTPPAPTTTQAPLAEFADCPTDALDGADGPVDITFWHGMNDVLEDSLIALTDAYNASQDRVRVTLQNQTGYNQTIDQFVQSSPSSRPVLVQFPEYTLQSFAQSGTLVPIEACIESSGLDTAEFIPRALEAYTWQGIQWAMPFNVSNPVLVLPQAEVRCRRARPRAVADHPGGAARDVAADRRQRSCDLRLGARLRCRLRWRLVPRAVVRAGG